MVRTWQHTERRFAAVACMVEFRVLKSGVPGTSQQSSEPCDVPQQWLVWKSWKNNALYERHGWWQWPRKLCSGRDIDCTRARGSAAELWARADCAFREKVRCMLRD